jgi:Fe-S cluster biogenesis protein NfuA/nitrite reductase/ring-hydroxylating ferredoxin subunit
MPRTAQGVGERIEQLLAGLPPGRTRDTAEELVRLVVGMYGDGLARLTAELDETTVRRLADDPLIGSLLLLHDLHPVDVDTRVQQALDRVRPYLGSHAGGVDYLGIDEQGVAQLSLRGNCDGCPSSTMTVKMAIEGALRDAAPELTGVEVAGVTEPKPAPALLQVGMGPPPGWNPPEPRLDDDGWRPLPEIGPPTGRPVAVDLDGTAVLLCSVRGTLYAYRDACAACGARLDESTVDGDVLACAGCGARFDVRLAGRGVDHDAHLEPLPLLSDSRGTRVAVAS